MKIEIIPCLKDNYSYLIIDKKTNSACVVDPSESEPIIEYLDKHKIKLIYILNTHHHYDHIGGNKELKKKYKAKVVGYAEDKNRIPGIDICLKDQEIWGKNNFTAKIFHKQMLNSLNILKNFPLETKVYCGHEYTLQNSKFCIKYDSNNKQLKEKIIEIKKKLSDGLPTIPSTIKEERECNIFLRSEDIFIQQNLKSNNSLETFSKLRDLKDNF